MSEKSEVCLCLCVEQNAAESQGRSLAPELTANDLLPSECGLRAEDFDEDDELIYERVVRSSIAPRGSYPWQVPLTSPCTSHLDLHSAALVLDSRIYPFIMYHGSFAVP